MRIQNRGAEKLQTGNLEHLPQTWGGMVCKNFSLFSHHFPPMSGTPSSEHLQAPKLTSALDYLSATFQHQGSGNSFRGPVLVLLYPNSKLLRMEQPRLHTAKAMGLHTAKFQKQPFGPECEETCFMKPIRKGAEPGFQ